MSVDSHKFKVINPSDNEADRILCTYLKKPTISNNFVEIDSNCVLYDNYTKLYEQYDDFEVRNSDIFIVTYPKSGTTWIQEMVWMIVNNLDFEGGKKIINERFPFLEAHSLLTDDMKQNGMKVIQEPISKLKKMDNPRLIKTHLPWDLLPKQIQSNEKQPKIIYVMRNPKDCCVSYYHFCITRFGFSGSFEQFAEMFLAGRTVYGSFWKHILGVWEHRTIENILILSYEQMSKDLPGVIKQVSDFLDKEISDEQIKILCDHLSFESMKNNKFVNFEWMVKFNGNNQPFMRCGKVGNYTSIMSPEMVIKFDNWTKQTLKDLDFPYKELLEENFK